MSEPVVELTEVRKSYPHQAGRVDVLTGVTMAVPRGERLAILGPSGSGKSTLLALLSGLDRPTSGTVRMAGQDFGAMDEQQLTAFRARTLGIVFQQFHLMGHLTALENVALPLRILRQKNPAATATAMLEEVGLGHRLSHLPHELSGGECQRVAIARALAPQPPVILADEPSGNLDAPTGEKVMGQLFDLVKRHASTLILVTHNEPLAAWCDRQLALGGGVLTDVSRG